MENKLDLQSQTEKENIFWNNSHQSQDMENDNLVVLDEMNPNLSFSSCPISGLKTFPSKESIIKRVKPILTKL